MGFLKVVRVCCCNRPSQYNIARQFAKKSKMLSCYCKQMSLDRKILITPSEDSDTALADEGCGGVVTVKEGNLLESPGEGITITEMSFHARQAFCYLAAVWPFFLCLDSYIDNIIFIRVTKVFSLSFRLLHWHRKS